MKLRDGGHDDRLHVARDVMRSYAQQQPLELADSWVDSGNLYCLDAAVDASIGETK